MTIGESGKRASGRARIDQGRMRSVQVTNQIQGESLSVSYTDARNVAAI